MASIATTAHLPVLREPDDRDQIGHELQATLHELVNLSLIGKQLHWAVVGPHFRSLHLQFSELVDSWRELADIVAKRARVGVHSGRTGKGCCCRVVDGSGPPGADR